MNAVDLRSDLMPDNRKRSWQMHCAAPSITSAADRAEALIRRGIDCRSADIRVQFDPSTGTLTLLGVVSSYYQKQLAQEAVRDLEQVSHFLNRLEVRSRILHPDLAVGLGTTAKPETDGESL